MMMKFYFSIVTIFIVFQVQSQNWLENLPQNKSNSTFTFFDYQNAFNSYWAPFNVVNGYYFENGVKKKAIGWKNFKRWEYQMSHRIDPVTGAFPVQTSDQVVADFLRSNSPEKSQSIANWTSLGTNSSESGYAGIGRINSIAFHPTDLNTYWAGSAGGGLWKTEDNGVTWLSLTDDLGSLLISDVIISPDFAVSNTLYMATGDRDADWQSYSIGLLKSIDGGITWETTGLTYSAASNRAIFRVLINPNNSSELIASTSVGVYKSLDGGSVWTQLSSLKFKDIEYNPSDATILYGSTASGAIYQSVNGGTSWVSSFSNSAAGRIELAVSADEPTWVYAIAAADDDGLYGIYKSVNNGLSYTQVFNGTTSNMLSYESDGTGTGGQGWYDLTLTVSTTDANVLVLGGINAWKSTDGGLNWSLSSHWWGDNAPSVHADKHFQAFRTNGDLFEGNDGGIYISSDEGATWVDKTNGMVISQLYKLGVSATVPNETIAGLQDNGTKLHSNGLWRDVKGGDGMECIIDYTDVNIQYGTYVNGQISRTSDHWASSEEIQPNDAGEGAWVTPYVLHPFDNLTLYAGYEDVWKTENSGASWNQMSTFNSPAKILSMAIAPSNPEIVVAATTNKIWKTIDGGGSWAISDGNLPTSFGEITCVTFKNDDPNTMWVSLSGYSSNRVYKSTNGGTTWTNISAGLPSIPIHTIVQNKQSLSEIHLFAGTDVGVYFKKGDSNWVPYNTNLPNVQVSELEIYYASNSEESKLRAATYGRGLWETPILIQDSSVSGVITSTAPCVNSSNEFSVSGYAGEVQWQKSVDGVSNWIDIAGENAAVCVLNLTTTMSVRAKVTLGTNEPAFSNVITVYLKPVLSMSAFSDVCSTDSSFTLVTGLPAGGVYSGVGVVDGKFDPSVAGMGIKTIHYTYGSIPACLSAIYKSILVEECNKTKTFEGVDYVVYPNPASGSFKLFYQSAVFNSFKLVDDKGRLVLHQNLSAVESEKIIDVSALANGIYSLRLISDDEKKSIDVQVFVLN
jgi:hypothetical protein